MSLVGPRPITPLELDQFTSSNGSDGLWTGVSGYWDIPNLRPGLTGLWQINGRSAIGYDERVRLDKLYVSNWSNWQRLADLGEDGAKRCERCRCQVSTTSYVVGLILYSSEGSIKAYGGGEGLPGNVFRFSAWVDQVR